VRGLPLRLRLTLAFSVVMALLLGLTGLVVYRIVRSDLNNAIDRSLAQGNGLPPGEALKRRAELVRLIERAETDWLAAAEAIEREARSWS